MHLGADPSTQCVECKKENAQQQLDLACTDNTNALSDHCNRCKPDFVYPEPQVDSGTFPKCVACTRGIFGRVCSGHGLCRGSPNDGFEQKAGLCICNRGWKGTSCATADEPNKDDGLSTAEVLLSNAQGCDSSRGVLVNGFCVCLRAATEAGPHWGGIGCWKQHTRGLNPFPFGDFCTTIDERGIRSLCANRGDCINGECSCQGLYDSKLRCTELKQEYATRHEQLMCLCRDESTITCPTTETGELTQEQACDLLN